MWPLVGIPQAIAQGMAAYRSVFCREAGFEPVSRYGSGLRLSANKTWQGMHRQWVFPSGAAVSRQVMPEAVFEARWDRERLLAPPRATVSQPHQGHGPEVSRIDWTLAHHERSEPISGVKRS
jgi:hypothetical protein